MVYCIRSDGTGILKTLAISLLPSGMCMVPIVYLIMIFGNAAFIFMGVIPNL